jgi:hypothetical protein
MSKIIKNNTAYIVPVADTGTSIPASGSYTIPPMDYWLWAQSSDVVTLVGGGTLTVNDGSLDLGISDGIDLIKGIYQKNRIIGDSDGTLIGNVDDQLKVIDEDVAYLLGTIAASLGAGTGTFLKQNEAAVNSRNKFDLSGTTYTVPTGKTARITFFAGSYDAQAAVYVRIEKQTGGVGAWVTQLRLNMMSGGQGNSTLCLDLGSGVDVGTAGDILKITVESSIAKGNVWAGYGGLLL